MAGSAVVGALRVILGLDTADYEKGLVAAGKEADKVAKGWSSMGRQATALGKTLTSAITLPLVAMAGGAVKAAMDFESSFANVAKTVDGVSDSSGVLTAEGKALSLSFRQLAKEIPATTDELNSIAALGGQMGVPIKQLESFTRHVAALGVAVDGISTEEAAAGLAQIGNISGKGTTEIAQMASALVHLGNSSNATESDILEFTKRLMGAGHAVNMSVPEVMAIGTAMANVGLNAEAGGTAMSIMISKMSMAVSTGGESLEAFNRIVAHTGKSFKELWSESPTQAVNAVVVGLGKAKESGADLNLVVRDIGATNIRTADTMKRLAGAGDGISTSLVTSNEGWRTANKHLEEAEKKYATTANQMKLLWNNVRDVGISLGDALLPVMRQAIDVAGKMVPYLESLLGLFVALPQPVQTTVLAIAGIAAAAGPVLWALGAMATAMGTLIGAFGAKGIATLALTGKYTALNAALSTLATRIVPAVAVAFAGWNIGKFIGDVTGAHWAIQTLTEKIFNLRDASEPLESQQRVIAQAIKLGADEGIKFAEALQYLKDHAAKLRGEWRATQVATEAATAATERSVPAYESAADAAERKEEADRLMKQAMDEATEAAERQRQTLQSLGIITQADVVSSITNYNEALDLASKGGSRAFAAAAAEVIKKLEELRKQAIKSGQSVEMVDAEIAALRAEILKINGPLPTLNHLVKEMDWAMVSAAASTKTLTREQMDAAHQAGILERAFGTLGVTTSESLRKQAEEARSAYRDILASGIATEEELKQARQRVLEAEIAAGERTASLWTTEIMPAVTRAWDNILSSVSTNLVDMMTGAVSFKDGFVAVWHDIKNSVLSILDQMLKTFLNEFIAGMMSGLNSFAKQAGKWLGDLIGMGSAIGTGTTVGTGAGAGAGVGAGAGSAGAGAGAGAGGAGAFMAAAGPMAAIAALAYFGTKHGMGPGGGPQSFFDEESGLAAMREFYGENWDPSLAAGIDWSNIRQGDYDWDHQRYLMGLPSFEKGTRGRYFDFGQETIAKLHGEEAIIPKGEALPGGGTVILEIDGARLARILVPPMADEIQRFRFA